MDIKYKLYPHPVLITGTDDFVNSSFEFTAVSLQGIREIILDFSMSLYNDEMKQLITDGKAVYLLHIECPQTCYRDIIKSDEDHFVKRIPEKYLNGKVTLCAFIVAAKDLEGYSNLDFNPDYKGIAFSVDAGSILAVGGNYDLNIVKEAEELAKIPSIFTICKYAADTDESMKIEMDGDKIAIALSNDSFQDYKIIANLPALLPATHAMIIMPALIYVFETLRREGIEEYENLRWFAAIRKTLMKSGMDLTEDVLNEIASYDLAQKILDLPVHRALKALLTAFDDSEETSYEKSSLI